MRHSRLRCFEWQKGDLKLPYERQHLNVCRRWPRTGRAQSASEGPLTGRSRRSNVRARLQANDRSWPVAVQCNRQTHLETCAPAIGELLPNSPGQPSTTRRFVRPRNARAYCPSANEPNRQIAIPTPIADPTAHRVRVAWNARRAPLDAQCRADAITPGAADA